MCLSLVYLPLLFIATSEREVEFIIDVFQVILIIQLYGNLEI